MDSSTKPSFISLDAAEITEDHTIATWNETTPGGLVDQNGTTIDDYFNHTNSSYAMADTHLPLLTYILFALTCFATCLGLFGNSLILAVMFKSRITEPLKGHDILVSALAFFDAIALMSTALSLPIAADIFGMDVRAVSTVGCKIFMSVFPTSSISSISIVVLICIERFIAIWYPFKARDLLSPHIVSRCLGLIVVVIILVYVTMGVLLSEIDNGICDPNFTGEIYSTVLKRVPNTTIYIGILGLQLVVSFIILLTLTPMILVKLYQQNRRRRQLRGNDQDDGSFQTSVKLTSVVVAFLTFVVLPNGIAISVGLGGRGLNDTDDLLSWLAVLLLLNYSINFLLYSIFDTQFRKMALRMLGFARE